EYQGNRTLPNAVAYLGIPYAEPPVGNLRFRAPLPLNTTRVVLESAGKTIDATEYPEFCIQGTTGGRDAGGAGSEDCLKVNIYAPPDATKASKLPVLFYIHGGGRDLTTPLHCTTGLLQHQGYIYGNPRNWPFDHWVNQSPNVVIVSVYYRLSSFGFLSVPEMKDSQTGALKRWLPRPDRSPTLGQTEHRELRWRPQQGHHQRRERRRRVRGASPRAKEGERLFSQAIAQSVYRTPLPTPEQQVPLFKYYAAKAGCANESVAESLSCLRNALSKYWLGRKTPLVPQTSLDQDMPHSTPSSMEMLSQTIPLGSYRKGIRSRSFDYWCNDERDTLGFQRRSCPKTIL
ncbi:alpha/beta-hydrolase, partial [Coprinellus micaceus]